MARYRKEIPTIYKNKFGYYVFWYYDGGKRRLKTTKCKKYNNAKQYQLEFLASAKERKTTLKSLGSDFYVWTKCPIVKYMESKGRDYSLAHVKSRRVNWVKILGMFGHLTPEELTSQEVDEWLINTKYSGQTKNHILQTGKTAFEYLGITPNPFDTIKKFAVNAKRKDVLTRKEVQMLFHPINTYKWGGLKWYCLFNLLVKTGMRSGEIRALQWKHIDITAEVVYILQSAISDSEISKTKTEHSQRVVPLIDNTLATLKEWRKNSEAPGDEDFIFYGRYKDKMTSKRSVSEAFKKARQGFHYLDSSRNLSPHSLRHTFVSLLRPHLESQGLKNDLGDLTGHTTSKMIDHYSHDQLQYRIDRLHQALEGFLQTKIDAFPELLQEEEYKPTERSSSTAWEQFDQ
jgi:integrase